MTAFYVVTGATRGIGRALCATALKNPQTAVIGVARTAATITHPNYTHVAMDLADLSAITAPDAFASVFAGVSQPFRKLVLINCAGQLHTAYLGRCDPVRFASMYITNAVAPGLLCNAFVQHFEKAPGDRFVINVSSGAADETYDGWAAYSGSKAALDHMSQVMQMEQDLHKTGIRVFSVHPGATETDMQIALRATTEDHFLLRTSDRAPRKMRISTPEQTAKRILGIIQEPDRFPAVVVNSALMRAAA
eukprot:EG_transcript_17065